MPRQYPQQFRERALRMVEESLPEQKCEFAAMKKVATKLGISPEAIRQWKHQSEVDSGLRPGLSAQEHDEIRRLRQRMPNYEERGSNVIVKSSQRFLRAVSRCTPVMGMISLRFVFKDRFELRGRTVSL
jgi:transposase